MTHQNAPPAHPGLPAPPPLGACALPPGTYEGSVVLVTGGGSGLGKAMAAEFARLGADLMIVGRSADRLKAAEEELAGLGGRVAARGVRHQGAGADSRGLRRGRGARSASRPSW